MKGNRNFHRGDMTIKGTAILVSVEVEQEGGEEDMGTAGHMAVASSEVNSTLVLCIKQDTSYQNRLPHPNSPKKDQKS